jgi:two-component sensor histidine kinase
MSLQSFEPRPEFAFPDLGSLDLRASLAHDALTRDLNAALAREQALLRSITELQSRHALLAREADHRLLNGLQAIASLLSAQSRQATPEAAAQLTVAVSRIVAFGQVNRRLHLLDHRDHVEFAGYLKALCGDLTALLLWQQSGCAITIEAIALELSTATAIPLSYAVNELVTNAVKYAAGDITVRLAARPAGGYSVSVADQGPGLPSGFDPAGSNGLGMRIVQSLLAQIGGEMLIGPGDHGRGACFEVIFARPEFAPGQVQTHAAVDLSASDLQAVESRTTT